MHAKLREPNHWMSLSILFLIKYNTVNSNFENGKHFEKFLFDVSTRF
jgi:hypothetical protein